MTWAALLVLPLVLGSRQGPAAEPPAAMPVLATRAVAPVYPDIARQARVEGNVVLELTVDEHGRPTVTAVKKTIRLLEQAARDAAASWRFPPGAGPVEVTFEFVLDDSDPGVADASPRVQFETPNRVRVTAAYPCVWATSPTGCTCVPQKKPAPVGDAVSK